MLLNDYKMSYITSRGIIVPRVCCVQSKTILMLAFQVFILLEMLYHPVCQIMKHSNGCNLMVVRIIIGMVIC